MDEKNPDDLGFLDGYVKVLKLGSGLMSTYDYSELYGTLSMENIFVIVWQQKKWEMESVTIAIYLLFIMKMFMKVKV